MIARGAALALIALVQAQPAIRIEGTATQGALLSGQVPPGTQALTVDGTTVPIAPDGRFVIGIDRDAGPVLALAALRTDGTMVRLPVAVTPRAWRIERLNTLARSPKVTPEFAQLRARERAQIVAARNQQTGAAGWRQRFIWPATGRISGLFGAQRIYRGEPGAYHSGVDVAGPTGAPVVAPADGVVVLAATTPFSLEGRLLIIDHGMGLNSAFLHLSRIDVAPGTAVRQGQPVGAIGATGRATGPHLHWSLAWRDARLDPLLAAGAMPGGR